MWLPASCIGINVQELNFDFSKRIQVVSNPEPKHISDPIKKYESAEII